MAPLMIVILGFVAATTGVTGLLGVLLFKKEDLFGSEKGESRFAGIALSILLAVATLGLAGTARADGTPTPTPAATPDAPFSKNDFSWVVGNTRETDFPMDGKIFSPEFLFDTNYTYDFAHPQDHTLTGSTSSERSDEFEVEHIGVGGDFHVDNVRGRIMTEFGMYATTVPRNDETPARGQFDLQGAYKYLTEAYGGYHFNAMHGINVDIGEFPSYVGLYSYYNSENWSYQASFVSSNTPWFFNGMRIQMFPTENLKIEPWIINGWQTYGSFNSMPNLGYQVKWAPTGSLVFVWNGYRGHDQPNSPDCVRYHSDNSIIAKVFDNPKSGGISKSAFSLTYDFGWQQGPMYIGPGLGMTDGVPNGTAYTNVGIKTKGEEEYFAGAMLYNHTWFDHNKFALNVGGGFMRNPGRYLALLPPINGDTAQTYGNDPVATTAFGTGPGLDWKCWDYQIALQIYPSQYLTWNIEYVHRYSDAPYFAGPGGLTSSDGWQSGAATGSAQAGAGFKPDLKTTENRIIFAAMVHI